MNMKRVRDGVMGLIVGDALGVPVEFYTRERLKQYPVRVMRGYGVNHLPSGTWSDDSSMLICTMLAMEQQYPLDYDLVMRYFIEWLNEGKYTPYGKAYGVGNTCFKAIMRYGEYEALECGGKSEYDNGNGSLMRILPAAYYALKHKLTYEQMMTLAHELSSLTHAHKRSQIACGIYTSIAYSLLLDKEISDGIIKAFRYYLALPEYKEELNHFRRIIEPNFTKLKEKDIRSTGYVVDSLEAALWCLQTTKNYKACELKAVNLGDDTDTIAAIAGGLAGILYGYYDIPDEWLEVIAKREWLEKICKIF